MSNGLFYDRVSGLNVVRSGRPEQCLLNDVWDLVYGLSQCSPVWKTGTISNR